MAIGEQHPPSSSSPSKPPRPLQQACSWKQPSIKSFWQKHRVGQGSIEDEEVATKEVASGELLKRATRATAEKEKARRARIRRASTVAKERTKDTRKGTPG